MTPAQTPERPIVNPDLPPLAVVARFAERGWRNPYVKNFQHCDLIRAGAVDPTKATVLASVNRTRKTKRSVWTIEVRQYASTSWMSPADFRAYYTAIADAAEAVEWPIEEDSK